MLLPLKQIHCPAVWGWGRAALVGHTTCMLGIHPFLQQGWRSWDHVIDSMVKV